jgi:hypothetical protein
MNAADEVSASIAIIKIMELARERLDELKK